MPTRQYPHLVELVEDAAVGLARVSRKSMFGCEGFWAGTNVFSVIWKEGRIGLKITEPEAFETLMGLPGARSWKPGKVSMSGWVLVPEAFHDDPEALAPWVKKAHGLALKAPARVKKRKAK